MSGKGVLGLALAAYLFLLLWQLPAQYAHLLLPLNHEPFTSFQGQELHGTWQQGGVRACRLGNLPLETLDWQFKPWALVTCRLATKLSGRTATSAIAATISRGWGTVTAGGVEGKLTLQEFAALFSPYGLGLRGVMVPKLERVVIRQGRVIAALGHLSWQGATIAVPPTVELGDLSMALITTSAGVKATIKDEGGPLQLQGNMLLKADGSYTLAATLAARQPAMQKVLDSNATLGQQQTDGRLLIVKSGVMPLLPL